MSTMFSDNFGPSTQQDLKTGGDGLKLWGWFSKNTANTDAIDVNSSNVGYLTIDCNAVSSGMGGTSVTVPMVYQVVAGDFDVGTLIVDNIDAGYEGSGLGIFNLSNFNLHIYTVRYASSGIAFNIASRSSVGTDPETTLGSDLAFSTSSLWRYLRVTRVGNLFAYYRKSNAGDAWTAHTSVTRNDLGSSVAIALYAMTNNASNTLVSKFDYFQFATKPTKHQIIIIE